MHSNFAQFAIPSDFAVLIKANCNCNSHKSSHSLSRKISAVSGSRSCQRPLVLIQLSILLSTSGDWLRRELTNRWPHIGAYRYKSADLDFSDKVPTLNQEIRSRTHLGALVSFPHFGQPVHYIAQQWRRRMLEYPRYDKRPACPLSTAFRTCHAVHNVQTVFALDPLPRMYVSFFISTLRPTRSRTNVYINPPKLLPDLARLRGSLFNPSERRSPAHFNTVPCVIAVSLKGRH